MAVAPVSALVSIVIPAYNASDLIGEALASVQQQTYPHWEVIIVEDGTEDGTAAIAQAFAQQVAPHPVRYHRHPINQGLSTTRNTGMGLAQGAYIALLDHDDLWEPEHLALLVAKLEQSKADIAFANGYFFHFSTHEKLGIHGPNPEELKQFNRSLYNRCCVPVSSVVFRREVYEIVGGFDPQLRKAEDLDYWLRCLAANLTFEFVETVTNGYRQRNPQAMTAQKADILEGHALVLRKHHRLPGIPSLVRGRILARYHLGVARRCWRQAPGKAVFFLAWSVGKAPLGTLFALGWFVSEALGWSSRHLPAEQS